MNVSDAMLNVQRNGFPFAPGTRVIITMPHAEMLFRDEVVAVSPLGLTTKDGKNRKVNFYPWSSIHMVVEE